MNHKDIYDGIDNIVKGFQEVSGDTLEDFLDTAYEIFDNNQQRCLVEWPSIDQSSMWRLLLQLYDIADVDRYKFMQVIADYTNGRVKLA